MVTILIGTAILTAALTATMGPELITKFYNWAEKED